MLKPLGVCAVLMAACGLPGSGTFKIQPPSVNQVTDDGPAPKQLLGGLACQPLSCAGVSVAAPPGFPTPNPATFVPDRRPAIDINLFGGSCTNPPAGGPTWWGNLADANGNGLVDAVDTLLGLLTDRYNEGWRRILVWMPAGSLSAQQFASSQWWTMPDAKRQSITIGFNQWRAAHGDATLGIYVGYKINDPCRLCMDDCATCVACPGGPGGCSSCPECSGVPPAHQPLTTSADDMCVIYHNIEPWIDAGLDEIWFDLSGATSPESILRLAGNPDYQGRIKFVSEPCAYQLVFGGDPNIPVADAVDRLAFVSTRQFYETKGDESWTFDPAHTEIHVMFRQQDFCTDQDPSDGFPCTGCQLWCQGQPETMYIDIIHSYVQRGFIPLARWTPAIEAVRRIFDINPQNVDCPDDLDMDGDVDYADAARVVANIGMTSGATLYHGDVDFDDDVDFVDYFLLVYNPAFPGGLCGN